MARAPARAKDDAIAFPRPLPPPVTRMVLPLADSLDDVGSMAGYTELWKAFVKVKGGNLSADILTRLNLA